MLSPIDSAIEKDALVIGGGGFLGRHLIEDLWENGYKRITIFDIHQSFEDGRFTFVVGGINDRQALTEAMKGHSVVFHVASPPYHLSNKSIFYRVNVEGSFDVIESCKAAGITRLVLTSSASVSFNGQSIKNGTEQMEFPSSYLDFYTETKMLQERIILDANGPLLRTCAIRPHGIFGPHDHTVSEIVKKADEGKMKFIIGDGSNIVDFTYVRNVTHGHLLAAEGLLNNPKEVSGSAFHITNDEPVQFWTFTARVLTLLGRDAPHIKIPYSLILAIAYLLHYCYIMLHSLFPGLNPPFLTPFKVALAGTDHYYSCEKASKVLGYRPVVSLKEGIARTVKAYQNKDM